MSLSPGTRVGVYEITAPLGVGGMGEVYRAKDSRLKREVALKVLPADVANDRERLARFQREAEVLAALNHPNIAHIHGLEESSGTIALVMELVEGEDLAERLKRGAIPLDEALPIAKQIAEALEAAHEQGIIHRDLKPANIKVRPDGTVKVLDFGLAKALDEPKGSSPHGLENSPTITSPAMTMRGLILGTAAYMAPEQAKGKAVDRRADIWAFGCVLYEMLSGARTFRGEDTTDTIAEVLKSTVDFSKLPASTPGSIRRLLERCLERDPRVRLRDIGEARIALQNPDAAPAPPPPTARPRPTLAAAAALALILVAMGAGAAWMARAPAPAPPRPVIRVAWPYGEGRSLRLVLQRHQLAISRNGRIMAGLGNTVWIKPIDQLTWTNVPGTADATSVFLSPDGEWVGFLSSLGISKVHAAGGSPTAVVATADRTMNPNAASWGDDGRIYFSDDRGVHAVAADGGTIETLLAGDAVRSVHVLPGSRALVYSRGRLSEKPTIVLHTLGTGDTTLAEGVSPRFIPPDILLFANGTTLRGARLDVGARRLASPPVALLEDVAALSMFSQYDVSDDGSIVYVPASMAGQPLSTLALRTPQGLMRSLRTIEQQYSDPRLSPDGRRLALHLSDQDNDVWVFDLERGALTRLSFHPGEDETPAWSPDGQWIAFSGQSRSTNQRSVFRRRADASGAEEVLWTGTAHTHVTDWSPDGRLLVLEATHAQQRSDVLLLDLASKAVTPLIATTFNESSARLSPDGRWIAYQSDESGRFEIYIQSFPALDRKIQISARGGVQPVWARDGATLYFRTETALESSRIHVANGVLRADAVVTQFEDKFVQPQGVTHTTFDVMADGSMIVFEPPNRLTTSWMSVQIVGIFNWIAEVREKLAPP